MTGYTAQYRYKDIHSNTYFSQKKERISSDTTECIGMMWDVKVATYERTSIQETFPNQLNLDFPKSSQAYL